MCCSALTDAAGRGCVLVVQSRTRVLVPTPLDPPPAFPLASGMSVDQTAAALAGLQLNDAKLARDLAKLHASHQHSFLPWRHLSAAHLTHIASLTSVPARREALISILGLERKFPLGQDGLTRTDRSATPEQHRAHALASAVDQDPNTTRIGILVDFALALLGFCWGHELSAVKTSTFFSILYTTHEEVAERPGPEATLEAAVEVFETLLLRHSVERPPFSIAVFSQPDVALLSGFVYETYLRQLKLYQYAFGTRNELQIIPTNSEAEQVNLEVIGVSKKPPPVAVPAPVSPEAAAAAAAGGSGATTPRGSPIVAAVAPAAVAPPAAAAAVAAAEDEWWNLDHALNYFPHRPGQTTLHGSGSAEAPFGFGAPASALVDDAEDDDDAYRDSASTAEFLEAQSVAAETALANLANPPVQLLESPEDQAAFDAAMAKELGALYKEFGTQLRAQQEAFGKRITEIEAAANGGTGTAATAGGNTSSRGSAGSADKTRPSKSRGK